MAASGMVSRQVLISQVPRVMRTRMSVAFTLDRYGHLYEDREHEIPDRLDQLLASSSAGLTLAQSEEASFRRRRNSSLYQHFRGGPNGI